jgi:hypothetical protein
MTRWHIGRLGMMKADWKRPFSDPEAQRLIWEEVMSGLKRKPSGLYKYEKKAAKESEKATKDRAKAAKKAAKK